jgi:hypothetical protein
MLRQTYTPAMWSVEQRSADWFYGNTNPERPREFRGPCISLVSVTLMGGRDMLREVLRRQESMTPQVPHAAE